jgi:hypothetical protein
MLGMDHGGTVDIDNLFGMMPTAQFVYLLLKKIHLLAVVDIPLVEDETRRRQEVGDGVD